MSKHTAGPWTKMGGNDCHKIRSQERVLAEVLGVTRGRRRNKNHDEAMANARLIAAAPEMLEVLKDIVESFGLNPFIRARREMSAEEINRLIKRALEAVSKAEGRE